MVDFVCIGAQKAGTTWVYQQLRKHPHILFPRGKEVHYWDWVELGKRPNDPRWYRDAFRAQPGFRLGDMTPAYAGLKQSSIEALLADSPACRVFYILRNPIDRAWSAARMVFDFSQLSSDEVDEDWFIRLFRSRASLVRGAYEENIRRWRNACSDEQFRIFLYDEIQENPQGLLERIAHFIEVTPEHFRGELPAERHRKFNSGPPLKLTSSLYAELVTLYASQIESLSAYLELDLTAWLKAPADLL